MTDAIKEGLKEGGRVILLAIVSYLLTVGVVGQIVVSLSGAYLDANIQLFIVGVITTVLRSIDKGLHVQAKEEPKKTRNEGMLGERGLTGF